MDLTAATLDEIIATTLPDFIRNEVFAQADQKTPALKIFQKKKKQFAGGEGFKLTGTAAMEYTTEWEIFSGEDELTFNEMNNKKLFTYQGVENHMGLKIPYTALKQAGFNVTDKNTKGSFEFSKASDSEILRITNFLEGKYQEMDRSGTQSFSKKRIWSDGSNGFLGIPGLITTTPTIGTTGGLSRVTNSKWRNRALVGANKIAYSGANQTLINTLTEEVRLLRVYGGNPDAVFCGNKFYKALEFEVRAKGNYTMTGFAANNQDTGIKGIQIQGLPPVIHEPALDDLGLTDYCYIIDTDAIALTMLDGDDMTVHTPARPHNKMVAYKSITWTGMMAAKQLNSSGVYQVDYTGL